MTREIKFRGKAAGTWYFGNLQTRKISRQQSAAWIIGYDESPTLVSVDPSTVGQFTGLHDMNGKEIYEGDIVKFVYSVPRLGKPSEERTDIGYVGFLQQEAGFVIVFKKRNQRLGRRSACEFCVEVIGNIYDNPELLNKED